MMLKLLWKELEERDHQYHHCLCTTSRISKRKVLKKFGEIDLRHSTRGKNFLRKVNKLPIPGYQEGNWELLGNSNLMCDEMSKKIRKVAKKEGNEKLYINHSLKLLKSFTNILSQRMKNVRYISTPNKIEKEKQRSLDQDRLLQKD
ncbi:hypothetical protein CR513_49298, partial [Mucuna pruriens]